MDIKIFKLNNKGQTLLEVVVVMAVGIVVVSAIVFATIASLRNAQFASLESRATGLSQEGLEKVRGIRNRNGVVNFTGCPTGSSCPPTALKTISRFDNSLDGSGNIVDNGLWDFTLSCTSPYFNCYFIFDSSGNLNGVASSGIETITGGFTRQILIENGNDGTKEKKITSLVNWTDFAGVHTSRISTVLRRP